MDRKGFFKTFFGTVLALTINNDNLDAIDNSNSSFGVDDSLPKGFFYSTGTSGPIYIVDNNTEKGIQCISGRDGPSGVRGVSGPDSPCFWSIWR